MSVIGIDPGTQGCLCILDGDYHQTIRLKNVPLEDVSTLLKYQNIFGAITAYKERVGAMGNRDKRSLSRFATFMRNDGALQNIILTQGIKLKEIEPQTWLRFFGLYGLKSKFMREGETESAAYNRAKMMYTIKARELFDDRKISKDMADGMLIAVYGHVMEYGSWNGKRVFYV